MPEAVPEEEKETETKVVKMPPPLPPRGSLSVADAMNKTDAIKYELETRTTVLLNAHKNGESETMQTFLRKSLDSMVGSIYTDFSKLSVRRVDMDRSEHKDTSLYSGSTGLLYALLKYVQMLKKEKKDDTEDEKLMEMQERLGDAIEANVVLML
jgi:hypothetical protein